MREFDRIQKGDGIALLLKRILDHPNLRVRRGGIQGNEALSHTTS